MKTARDANTGGYHPMHWLIHAYTQIGRDDDAVQLLGVIEEDAKTNTTAYNRTHLAMCRATILVEMRGRGPALAMQPVEGVGRSIGAFSNHDLAIGLESVRRNDLTAARKSLDALKARNATGSASRGGETAVVSRYTSVAQSDIDAGPVMEAILASAIEFASGNRDDALRKIVAAAEAEDRLIFEYGPPAIVKPAWEQAGEMLLAAGKKAEAANAFRNALKRYPNRRLSNEGLKAALAP
jgi:tetratricopeptide (TPR) repeat protein